MKYLRLITASCLALMIILFNQSCGTKTEASQAPVTAPVKDEVEKAELTLVFIKLTDMAPLAIAK
jgi:hypothetical protein